MFICLNYEQILISDNSITLIFIPFYCNLNLLIIKENQNTYFQWKSSVKILCMHILFHFPFLLNSTLLLSSPILYSLIIYSLLIYILYSPFILFICSICQQGFVILFIYLQFFFSFWQILPIFCLWNSYKQVHLTTYVYLFMIFCWHL